MKSELNIMHGDRSWIHVIQQNTNDTQTGEQPGYMFGPLHGCG